MILPNNPSQADVVKSIRQLENDSEMYCVKYNSMNLIYNKTFPNINISNAEYNNMPQEEKNNFDDFKLALEVITNYASLGLYTIVTVSSINENYLPEIENGLKPYVTAASDIYSEYNFLCFGTGSNMFLSFRFSYSDNSGYFIEQAILCSNMFNFSVELSRSSPSNEFDVFQMDNNYAVYSKDFSIENLNAEFRNLQNGMSSSEIIQTLFYDGFSLDIFLKVLKSSMNVNILFIQDDIYIRIPVLCQEISENSYGLYWKDVTSDGITEYSYTFNYDGTNYTMAGSVKTMSSPEINIDSNLVDGATIKWDESSAKLTSGLSFIVCTTEEYESSSKDSNTIYFITD